MPILALKSVKKWKEKTKTDGEETEKDVAYMIAKPPEPKHKMVLMRDKVLFFFPNIVCVNELCLFRRIYWSQWSFLIRNQLIKFIGQEDHFRVFCLENELLLDIHIKM